MSNAADIAREAARLISERGLAKGALMDSSGALCHNGAVYVSAGCDLATLRGILGGGPGWRKTSGDVLTASGMILARRGMLMPTSSFNDDPATSAEDVILLLKEAAEILDQQS